MEEIKLVDGRIMFDGDLSNYDCCVGDNEPFYGTCPVCGSEHVECDGESLADFEAVYIRSLHCRDCKSDFSLTYWIKAIVIYKDGRFHKED